MIEGLWINAAFFAIEKEAFSDWAGKNLEKDVLPAFAREGKLYSYLHRGFWQSMDTSKDQQELETIYSTGSQLWLSQATVAAGRR